MKGVPQGQMVLVCHIEEGLYRAAKEVARERRCKLREVVDAALEKYLRNCDEAGVLEEVLGNGEVVSKCELV